LNSRFASVAGAGGAAAAIVLSPMLACEELWLLARWARRILPRCVLVAGHVPMVGRDETFPKGFRILAEKCPNRRGVERILAESGGATLDFDGFLKAAAVKKLTAAYLTGGYGPDWLPRPAAQALSGLELLVVHDLFPTAAEETAAIQIPSAAWTEREGSFINAGGIVQPFDRVVPPLEGVKADGQLFAELAGETGLYRARRIRESMAASMSEFASVHVPRELPQHAH
jgi:NADH-quinone oxidoreductase subunit G